MKLIKNIFPFLVLITLTFFAVLPLFHSGFFPMHDDEQIARLQQLTVALNNWQIPPRWVPDLGFGYGFPLFNFYPPQVYYFGFVFHLIGFSFIDSTKVVMLLGFILSAVFMFLWVRRHYGFVAGLFSGFLYTYAPYHAVDLYVRGAFSEFFSFVWIPAVFWSLDRLSDKKTLNNSIIVGIFIALVILTHNLVFIQFIPFLFIYILFLYLNKWRKALDKLYLLIFPIILSFGLTLYFTLPAIFEKQYTLVDKILTGELANYKLYFVCPNQFYNSPWGYGGSIAGCVDGMTFQIGKIQLLVSIVALIYIFYAIISKNSFFKNIKLPFISLTLFIFSIFMSTSYSSYIWQLIQPLSYIQFPWRFLLFTAVFASFLGGFFITILQKYLNKFFVGFILIALMIISIYTVRMDFQPSAYIIANDSLYTSKKEIQWRVSRMSYEYVPNGVTTKLTDIGTTMLDITIKDLPNNSYRVLSGKMNIREVVNKPQQKIYEVNILTPGQLRINTYSFPGWTVLVDKKTVKYNDNNKLKLITVNLGKGKHTVEVIFKNTWVRTIGDIVSGLTILSLIIFGIKLIINKKFK